MVYFESINTSLNQLHYRTMRNHCLEALKSFTWVSHQEAAEVERALLPITDVAASDHYPLAQSSHGRHTQGDDCRKWSSMGASICCCHLPTCSLIPQVTQQEAISFGTGRRNGRIRKGLGWSETSALLPELGHTPMHTMSEQTAGD